MTTAATSPLLRIALVADAAASGALALLQLAAAGPLAAALALPQPLLAATGAFLLGWTALLARLATRPAPAPAWVGAVVAGNVLWSAGCIALPAAGLLQPNGLGMAYLMLQAVAVLVFAALQFVGSRWAAADEAAAALSLEPRRRARRAAPSANPSRASVKAVQ